MKLLLDTHVLIWWMQGDPRISPAAHSAMLDANNEIVLSSVAAIEIAIKLSLGKIRLPTPLDRFWADATASLGATELPLTARHANALQALPFNHRDPFDRLLVAQAIVESFTIVSGDAMVGSYSVSVIW